MVGRNDWENLMNNNHFLMKALSNQNLKRPAMDRFFSSSESGAKVPLFPVSLRLVQAMADDVDALRLVIEIIQREMFKNGFEIIPKYKYKCKNPECEKEYKTKPIDMEEDDDVEVSKGMVEGDVKDEKLKCDVCGKTEFSQPSPQGRKKLQDLLDKPQNDNNQKLEPIAKMFERDLDVFDNAYLLLLYDYSFDSAGEITGKTLKEMLTISPISVEMIGNMQGRLGIDDQGQEHYTCVRHRTEQFTRRPSEEKPRCNRCKRALIRAVMCVNNARTGGLDGSKLYYGLKEMIFLPGKYKPGLLYGYSPVFSIWSKCESLKFMDDYVRQYFDRKRPPRSLLLIGTKNTTTAHKAWDQLKAKAAEDPYDLHPLMVESDRGGRNMIQHVDLTGSLAELQFIEVRAEFKRAVGAMYGILPLFGGDVPNGWSNDSESMAITNRAIKWGQRELRLGLFDPLCKLLEVDDWILQLKESEETDILREQQIEAAKVANAQGMKSIGFQPRINSEGDFVYSSKPMDEGMIGDQGGLGIPKEDGGMKEEEMTDFEGERLSPRPSDQGGTLQGTPASGPGTSLSRK